MLMLLPIFVPNDSGFEQQLDSIRSLNEYLEKYPVDNLNRIYCGWCSKEEYWTSIKELVSDPIIVSDNIGKALIVNDLFDKYSDNEDWFFTCDSDIKFEIDQEDIFGRLLKLSKELSDKNLGLISINQHGHNCQLYDHQCHNTTIGGELISWAPHGRALAGGALFISTKAFRQVGRYNNTLGPYGSDDDLLLASLKAQNFFACCARNMFVFHPHGEIKEGYMALKGDLLWNRKSYQEVTDKLRSFWGIK